MQTYENLFDMLVPEIMLSLKEFRLVLLSEQLQLNTVLYDVP